MDNETPTPLESQPSAPEVVTQTTTPPAEKPKSYGGNWKKWILVYLAIGAIIYAGVYYFVLAKQNSKPYAAPITKAKLSPSPTTISDPTTGWKTYRNNKYGYSIKYPSDEYSMAFCGGVNDVSFDLVSKKHDKSMPDPLLTCPLDFQSLKIYVMDEKTPENSEVENQYSITTENVLIDKVNAVKKTMTCSNRCKGYYSENIPWQAVISMAHNNKFYVINFTEKGNEPLFNQILQTFKFTEQQKIVTLPAEIQSFPVYTNAKFVKKEVVPPCKGETSGYSNCGQTLYVWSSPDDGNIIQNWYQNSAESGWACGQGGAGEYTSSRNFYRNSTCIFQNKTYGFILEATQKETTITLSIKN